MKVALIDADSIIHIVSYHNSISMSAIELFDGEISDEDKEAVIQEMYEAKESKPVLDHVDSFINDILNKVDATHYLGFVGSRNGSHTFRHDLAVTKPYKGNRKSSPHWVKYWKPIIVSHMVEFWKFQELHNIEADDAIGICATGLKENYVICSPDKDLKQLPGDHYDYKKVEHSHIEPLEGVKNLYTQLLVGDSVDGIPGCPKIGAKSKFLEFPGCTKPEDFHAYAAEVYRSKDALSIMGEQLSLVYMLRNPDGVDLKTIPTPLVRPEIADASEEMVQEEEQIMHFPDQNPSMFTQ